VLKKILFPNNLFANLFDYLSPEWKFMPSRHLFRYLEKTVTPSTAITISKNKLKKQMLHVSITIQNLYVLTPHFGCPQEAVAQQHIKFGFYHFGF
jgi:hypothetical protein